MTDETKSMLRAARMKQRFPIKMTKIEQMLFDEFSRLNLDFTMHKNLVGRWQPDFTFENSMLMVQADGDYWHSLPSSKERDDRFNADAKSAGYTVLRFWEKRIHADLAGCVSDVLAHIGAAQETASPTKSL